METSVFDYDIAFSRNIGLLNPEEQERVGKFTIAIPGMGGGGGAHLITLVRQGFQNFKIADRDTFELKNFNRQYGARLETIGRTKVDVMLEEALKINPNCRIEIYGEGIDTHNIDAFLAGVDLCVDALDAFEIDTRRMFFTKALENNIPIVTAGPIGFGSAFLVFLPGGPTFDEYFDISDALSREDKLSHFFIGLLPSLLQRSYMKRTNVKEKRGPSSIGSINIGAGIVAIYALKILLKIGSVKAVPYYHQFDVMMERYVCKRLWLGNRNPVQKIKLYVVKRFNLIKD